MYSPNKRKGRCPHRPACTDSHHRPNTSHHGNPVARGALSKAKKCPWGASLTRLYAPRPNSWRRQIAANWHRFYPRARISHCRDASTDVSKPIEAPARSPSPIASQTNCIDLKRYALNRCRFCSCKIVLEVAFLQLSHDCYIHHRLRLHRRPPSFNPSI